MMLRGTMSLRRVVDTHATDGARGWRRIWKGCFMFSIEPTTKNLASNHAPDQEIHLSIADVNDISGRYFNIDSPCASIRGCIGAQVSIELVIVNDVVNSRRWEPNIEIIINILT